MLKMRRIIICAVLKYPRGGATANYIQYLSDALVSEGYEVLIFACINREYSKLNKMDYRGATIVNIWEDRYLQSINRILNGKLFWKRLSFLIKCIKPRSSDVIIAEKNTSKIIFKLREKYCFKTVGWPLEWYGREQYNSDHAAMEGEKRFRLQGENDLLFPISHYIAEQFKDCRCKILVLPIMADTQEREFIPPILGKEVQFIFSANGRMKDSLREILQGIAMLDIEERKLMRFHLTGVKLTTIKNLLSDDDFNKVKQVLICHDWMKYDDLIELYRSMNFLFLARAVNQMTLSNFPSKVPEAMTYGIVPVVSRVGDYTKYYLQDGVDSLIFDGDSSTNCRDAMRRAINLSSDEYKRLSLSARKTAEVKFDFRNWKEKIHESIESLFA